jgi:hypothetical protein
MYMNYVPPPIWIVEPVELLPYRVMETILMCLRRMTSYVRIVYVQVKGAISCHLFLSYLNILQIWDHACDVLLANRNLRAPKPMYNMKLNVLPLAIIAA